MERQGRFAARGSGWIITRHAMDRFIARHAPGTSLNQAKKRLTEAALIAERRGERTVKAGDTHWKVKDDPPLILVTREVRGQTTCVTVLGAAEEVAKSPLAQAVKADAVRQLEEEYQRRLRRAKERRRSTRKELERALKENERLRACLSIAVRGLMAVECIEEAASALAEIETVDPTVLRNATPGSEQG